MKKTLTFITLSITASSCLNAANVIAYNFAENWHAKTIQGDGTVFGTDQWTDSISTTAASGAVAANSTDANAVTTPFNAPGVTVSWSSSGMYQAGTEGGALENQLFRRYLDDGGDGPLITVSGLGAWLTSEGANGYKVTFYQNSDATNNNFAQMDLYNGAGKGGTLLESMAAQLSDGSGDGDGSRLIRTAAGTFTNDTITFHTDNGLGGGARAGVSGFKIEALTVPEPSSAALLGLGGLALILRRRK